MQHTRVLAANEVGISLFLSSEVVAQRQLERLSNMPKSPNGLKRRASLNNRGGVKQGVLRGLHPNARERNNCVCVCLCVWSSVGTRRSLVRILPFSTLPINSKIWVQLGWKRGHLSTWLDRELVDLVALKAHTHTSKRDLAGFDDPPPFSAARQILYRWSANCRAGEG